MISASLIEYLKKGIFTLLGLIVAVYLFVILLTYTGNDPSWSHISSDMTTINNMGGAMGAWLSDLFYSFFGFGAWWLLAFLIYESILIWWNNKPTFWLLRLTAYIFLILSASAWFAQLVSLIEHMVDPVSNGLKGVAGGIIGLELQSRLAQLLTPWGSVTFLTVFVIITATFAFNIHWLALYRQFTDFKWLGSGVRGQDADKNTPRLASEAADNQMSHTDDEGDKYKDGTAKTNHSQEVGYEQLPLELQAQQTNASQDETSSRFGHVLSDFLSKSGIGDSVKASMVLSESLHTNPNHSSDKVAGAQNANLTTTLPIRKVEPSFAWNDSDTVEDLLAQNINREQNFSDTTYTDADLSDYTTDYADSDNQQQSWQPMDDEIISVDGVHHIDGDDRSRIEDFQDSERDSEPKNVLSDTVVNSTVDSVDTLAEAWLAEHVSDSVADVIAPLSETIEHTRLKTPEDNAENLAVTASDEPLVDANTFVSSSLADLAAATVFNDTVATVDMTPTNTPPANPKEAPTVEIPHSAQDFASVAVTKPVVSFAVPEGDSSNHITDMMPEEDSRADDTDVPIMPHISNDAAFSQKSRSMQTAAYRSSLTPIPDISILDKPDPNRKPSYTLAELEQLSELLEIKLQEFNVKANVVNAIPGPVVTRFEVELAAGVKASKVTGISRDLARSLSMASLRVVEVIPGKPYIGIEVPNKQREMVRLIELLNTEKFNDPKAQISMAMGKDIGGNPIITDLARAPHMLVAGTTGSGKSVLVNSMLLSMLLKYTPNELRLILIDPKQLELANYNDIPHLLTPVVTDMTEAASALSWCVAEMERRYQLMSLLKVRKLNEFNKKVIAAEKSGNPMIDPLWRPNDSVSISQAPKLKTLPMIVIVADEFADMIMQVGKQAEELITRLAQKSRAAGIHLILATQRPSVDVITGLIKANIPVRAALRVNSKVDSRTILDSGGAEDMLGNGDMLFLGPGQIEPDRVHGAYVSDEEVNSICDAWRERGAPDYIDNMAGNFELSSPNSGGSTANASGEDDDLYNEAVGFIMETRKVSASSIQRKFSIGYNRAARIVDSMEEAGLVSSMGKSGKRELLM